MPSSSNKLQTLLGLTPGEMYVSSAHISVYCADVCKWRPIYTDEVIVVLSAPHDIESVIPELKSTWRNVEVCIRLFSPNYGVCFLISFTKGSSHHAFGLIRVV